MFIILKSSILPMFCHLHIMNTLYVPKVLGEISLDILLSWSRSPGPLVFWSLGGRMDGYQKESKRVIRESKVRVEGE